MSASTAPTRSLEPQYYTDPGNFVREMSGLLARTWQFAGHVSQVAAPGDYFTFRIADENLFCIRGTDGEVRAFYNVCQHRAHELLDGTGNCRAITCPYHAWSYGLDGQLKGGPNIKSMGDFPMRDIKLTEVLVDDFCGFLFVNLDPDAAPMDTWFPGARAALRDFVPHIDTLAPMDWIAIDEQCNWKISVENYSECYHCSLNHRAFVAGVINPKTYNIEPNGHALWHTTECQNLDKMSYKIDPSANTHAADYGSWFLWPAFSFQVYPGNILNTYHWRPEAVDRVTVWRGWYSREGVEDAVVRQLAIQDLETTVAEDVRLVESVQRGLNSRGYRPGPLVVDPSHGVNSEHSIQTLQQWMREAVDD